MNAPAQSRRRNHPPRSEGVGRWGWIALLLIILAADATAEEGGAAPRRGGTLRLVSPTDWRSLDPVIAFDGSSTPLQKLLFRGLLDYDGGINLIPDQASDWAVSPDGKTYTFHLRPGVKFAHGREVEAADYIYSFERVLNPKTASVGQTYLMDIVGAEEFNLGKAPHVTGLRAPDARTLIIELKKATFVFRYILAMNFTDALPRELVEKYGKDFQYHMIGSGPYVIKEWRRHIGYRFERNPFYSGTDGYVDRVDLMIGGDQALHAMMVERGDLDFAIASAADAVRFTHDARLRPWLLRVPQASTDYFFMNTEVKPFDDVRVRRAINHAVNHERMLKLAGGFGTVAHGIVPPSMPWTNSNVPVYPYNPERARELLREAGFPNGFKTQLSFISSRTQDSRMAGGIAEDLRVVGIEVELQPLIYSAFEVKVATRKSAPCGVWGWQQDYPDASNFLDVLLSGDRITDTECNNTAFYSNPKVNQLLGQAGASVVAEERLELFRAAERQIMADAPWVPTVNEVVPVLVNPRVHGAVAHPVWMYRYEKMWLTP